MKPFTRSFLFAVAAPVAAVLAQDPADKPADYVAHEWGTFTSMVGTNGIVLEGLQREEEALPRFVHDLLRIAEAEEVHAKIPSSRVTQKMETPVIYFHTDQALRVRVDVWFAHGLMTQFYPLPGVVTPDLQTMQAARIDMSKVDGSALHWDIDLVPRTEPAPREIPAVGADEPWAIARQVHAAWVRTANQAPAKAEAEHYLFYRGLGRWQPKLLLARDGAGAVKLTNGMRDEVPFVAVLELGAQGGRFAVGQPLAGGATQRIAWGDQEVIPSRALLAGRLGDAVHKALVRSGLFEDEARAMVATWSRSWFQKDGARVIYVLPRSEVDQVLPLSLQPAPRELVRTLVGRLEFITTAAQQNVERALRDSSSPDGAVRGAGELALAALDRFLEPHLRNVASNGSDAAVRALAERRLAAETR
jgi:hypothetical protein